MTPAALSLARRVRELLSEPGRWTQGAKARTATGAECLALNPSAACWCLLGAMVKCAPGRTDEVRADLTRALYSKVYWSLPYGFFTEWHDNPKTTHADVLALLDRVIEDGER